MKEEETAWEEAMAKCKATLQRFTPKHRRISLWIGFEIEPAIYADCPYYDTPKKALDEARSEDICQHEVEASTIRVGREGMR